MPRGPGSLKRLGIQEKQAECSEARQGRRVACRGQWSLYVAGSDLLGYLRTYLKWKSRLCRLPPGTRRTRPCVLTLALGVCERYVYVVCGGSRCDARCVQSWWYSGLRNAAGRGCAGLMWRVGLLGLRVVKEAGRVTLAAMAQRHTHCAPRGEALCPL